MKINKKHVLTATLIATGIIALVIAYFSPDIAGFLKAYYNDPKEVTVSNITESSLTVNWYTDYSDYGYVIYSTNKNFEDSERINFEFFNEKDDVRDEFVKSNHDTYMGAGPDITRATYTHSMELTSLEPNTKYYFAITNGVNRWETTDISTEELTENPTSPKPLLGQIKEGGSTYDLRDTIIYIQDTKGETVLSTQADYYGYWVVDVAKYIQGNQNSEIIIKTQYQDKRELVEQKITYSDYIDEKVVVELPTDFASKSTFLINPVLAADGVINCNQDAPNQSASGVKSQSEFGSLMDRWTNHQGKNYARECYNDVICRAKSEGVDPAFALMIWANESGASNYTFRSAQIKDFGIVRSGVPAENFDKQIDWFLSMDHEYDCPDETYWDGWASMYLNGVCDPDDDSVTGNPGRNYLEGLQEIYTWVSTNPWPDRVKGSGDGRDCGEANDSGDDGDDGSDGDDNDNPPSTPRPPERTGGRCCGLILEGTDYIQGDYENQIVSCDDFIVGHTYYDRELEYSIEIPGISNENSCAREFSGVCCNYDNEQKWVPSDSCNSNSLITGITDKTICNTAVPEEQEPNEYSLTVNKGMTLISVPFDPVDPDGEALTAVKFMAGYSSQYNDQVRWIGKYADGKWDIITVDDAEGRNVGNDFEIVAGDGYALMSESDAPDEFELEFLGYELEDDLSFSFVKGWNLIGIDKSRIEATDFIDDNEGLEKVSFWESSLGYYKGITYESDELYGDDFSMEKELGYFVYLTDENAVEPPEEEEDLEPRAHCCGLMESGQTEFRGDFEGSITSCDAFEVGKTYYDGALEYAVEIPDKSDRNSCEDPKYYSGVCCNTGDGQLWVPTSACESEDRLGSITNKTTCNK